MAFNILFSEASVSVFSEVPDTDVAYIIEKISLLSSFPRLPNLKMLSRFTQSYCFRAGEYKILFHIQAKNITIEKVYSQY